MGILGEEKGRMPLPDYRMSIPDLYQKATHAVLSTERSLIFLRHAIGLTKHKSFNLASWVCDWSQERGTSMLLPYTYDASKGFEYGIKPPTLQILALCGVPVGSISTLGQIIQPSWSMVSARGLSSWRDTAKVPGDCHWYTFLANIFLDTYRESSQSSTRRLSSADYETLKLWWSATTSGLTNQRYGKDIKLNHLHRHFNSIIMKLRLYVTTKGSLGMAPLEACVDDQIFVMKGSQVPLCLRPVKDSLEVANKSHYPGDFLLVGQCSMHGIMDGEAVGPETEWQTLSIH